MRWPWQPAPPDPLGDGVWRRLHDRFDRAVDRYHQMMERVAPGPVRDELERTGTALALALRQVRAVCVRAQAAAPSAGLDVPGHGWTAVHRALSSAATQVAQAAEAAAMARVAEGASDDAGARQATAAARRAAVAATDLVARAVADADAASG